MNLQALTPTVPAGFEFLLAPAPPLPWGLEYPLVARAAHYISASTIKRTLGPNVTVPKTTYIQDDHTAETRCYCRVCVEKRTVLLNGRARTKAPVEDYYESEKSWELTDVGGKRVIYKGTQAEARAEIRKITHSVSNFDSRHESSFNLGWSEFEKLEHYPLGSMDYVHPSLRSWVKSQAPSALRDPNFSRPERMTAPHTNGVIPTASTTAELWQMQVPPVVPQAPSVLDFGNEETYEPVALRNFVQTYEDDPRTIAARAAHVPAATRDQVRTWEKAIADETKWVWMDETTQAVITHKRAYAEALTWGDELWLAALTRDKKLYHPAKPRVGRELDSIKVVGLKSWSHFVDEDSEGNKASDTSEQATADRFADNFIEAFQHSSEGDSYGDSNDESTDGGFEADGISYFGVRRTNDPMSHSDLQDRRDALRAKYADLIQRTKFMNHDERKQELRKERDAHPDALRLLVVTSNGKLSRMFTGGKVDTLRKQIVRADLRTTEAQTDADALSKDPTLDLEFTKAIKGWTTDEVHAGICQGGFFIVVKLNNRFEVKRLAPLGTSEDEVEILFEETRKATMKEAVKQAKKTALDNGLGKRATLRAVDDARARVNRAFESVNEIHIMSTCPVHGVPGGEVSDLQPVTSE